MKAYLVGGAVRDLLLNRPHKERDWVVVGEGTYTGKVFVIVTGNV